MILVTLVCCYAACWGPTKKYGPEAVRDYCNLPSVGSVPVRPPEAIAPLLLSSLELGPFQISPFKLFNGPRPVRNVILDPSATMPFVVRIERGTRRYYFWFFGYVAKLPYERDIKPVVNGVSGAT